MNGSLTNTHFENQGSKVQISEHNVFVNQMQDEERVINHNKPWRVVIKRIVSDGESNYEDVYGEQSGN